LAARDRGSVISPVIAMSRRTGLPDISDASAVEIATPAEGPSFGMAPAGTCMLCFYRAEPSARNTEFTRVIRDERERGASRFFHHVAELAGENE